MRDREDDIEDAIDIEDDVQHWFSEEEGMYQDEADKVDNRRIQESWTRVLSF